MPLEGNFRKAIDAKYSFTVLDMDRRLVAFSDQSTGKIEKWALGLRRRREFNGAASGPPLYESR